MTHLAREIARLHDAPLEELAAVYERLYGEAPRLRRRVHLWRKVAWKLQADAYGGLSSETERRLAELAAEGPPVLGRKAQRPARTASPQPRPQHTKDGLAVGTELVREWRGQQIRVRVVPGGFEHEGVVHASLSAVARAVTGARWNGRLFFGLTGRRRGGAT